MISGQLRYAISGSGWRHQASLALGPLAVLGLILFSEEGPETTHGRAAAAGVINQPPPRNLQRPPPKVSLLNASALSSPATVKDDHWPSAGVADELPNAGIRVRTSNAVRFRTWCVRLCDGFYYPINYLTTRGQLQVDDEKCRASCSSEARLYVNTVLARTVSPLADLSGRPYTALPTAFAYRAAMNPACSCDGSRMVVTSSTIPPRILDAPRTR